VPVARRTLIWTALAVLAALPVGTAWFHQLRAGWFPESDDATIVMLAGDSMTTDPPLVGMISTAGAHLEDPELHHPGPIEFYLLAPLSKVSPAAGSTLTAALVSVASIGTLTWVLYLMGGSSLAGVGLVGSALILWGVGADTPVSVWNPHVVVMPFAVFLVGAVAVSAGRNAALPVMVAAGSLVAQTHLSYVGLVGAVAAWVAVVVAWRSCRGAESTPSPLSRRPLVLAGVLAVGLWLPPLIQQLTGHPGNLTQIVRALTAGPGGEAAGTSGLAEFGRVVGIPVAGISPDSAMTGAFDPMSLLSAAALALPFLLLAVLLTLQLRRARELAPVTITVMVILLAGAVTASRIPLSDGILYRYYALWMRPLAVVVWMVTGWLAWLLLPPARAPRSTWAALGKRNAAASTALLVALLLAVAALPRPATWAPWAVQRRIAGEVAGPVKEISSASTTVVRFRGATPYLSTGSAVALATQQAGGTVLIDPGAPSPVFPWREFRRYNGQTGMNELWVRSGMDPRPPPGATLVVEVPTLTDQEASSLRDRRARIRDGLTPSTVRRGPRQPSSSTQQQAASAALADPVGAFDDGTLADLAVRDLIVVDGISGDELFEIQRLTTLGDEHRIQVWHLAPSD